MNITTFKNSLKPVASIAAKREETTEGKMASNPMQKYGQWSTPLSLGKKTKNMLAVHDERAHRKIENSICLSTTYVYMYININPWWDHVAAGDDNEIG